MWKDGLAARFHKRSSSYLTQGFPLMSETPGSRPLSTASLGPVPELLNQSNLGSDQPDRPSEVPSQSQVPAEKSSETPNSQPIMPVTDTATANSHPAALKKHETTLTTHVPRDIESFRFLGMRSIRSYFMEELDTAHAVAPLSAYCFMTGFIDAVSFSAIFVWCAFQTGNTIQLSLALARLFNGQQDYSFHIADQQALCSVLCFIFGAFAGRIGDKIGCKTRLWMTLGTFVQTLLTMSAAIAIWQSGQGSVGDNRGDPAWTNALSFVALGFMSASMGLQGIMGKRLNTQFTTTVVLTTTWCELMTEPKLFNFRRLVAARDHKVIAILFLFLGGFVSRAILDKIGSAGTLGVGAGLRCIITLCWLLVPAKKSAL